ncbi:MAG: penicillin-binding protein 2 [Chitinophagaceae bacterium]
MSVFNQSRSNIIRLIFLGVFIIILGQLINLQLFSDKYKTAAMSNALFAKVVYPDRGIIYDKKEKAILTNTIMYDLVVTPNQVKNIDTTSLCDLLGIDTTEFKRRMVDAIFKNTKFRPSVFEDLLPPALYAKLDENIWKFPGFDLVERPVRQYPFGAAAHIMGYVGEADSSVIKRSNGFYRLGDYVGRSGLEQYYESVLMGRRGVKYIIKDNKNRLQGSYEKGMYDTAAIAGRGLHTYLDIKVQQLAEKLMSNKVGAVVALEPKSGGIIAMVSGPNFDPNLLTGPEKQENFNKLFRDVSSPLLNRAIKGQYPPGSTYKPLGALVALDEGVITPNYGIGCAGAYLGCNRPVKCTEKFAGHARNLRIGLSWSCNSFFSSVFRMTVDNPKYRNPRKGLEEWYKYMTAFGYGHRLGVDLPSEDGGNIPDTVAYDKEYRGQWNSCTMVTLGIGQDKMTATPLQIANAISIVANKGYYYVPHFVEKIDGETAEDTAILNKFRTKHEVLTHIPDSSYEAVIDGMEGVMTVGTGRLLPKIPGINVCGKTGTAENYHKGVKQKDHSVFVLFAPREDPKVVIAVVVQNGGFGAAAAGPIANILLEQYLTDSLRETTRKEVERVTAINLMPKYFISEQYTADSIRAFNYYKQTKDSSAIKKYMHKMRLEAPPAAPIKGSDKTPVITNDPADKTKTTKISKNFPTTR